MQWMHDLASIGVVAVNVWCGYSTDCITNVDETFVISLVQLSRKSDWKLVNRQSSGYITEYREDICYVTCGATCTVQRTLRPVEYR